MQAYIACGGQGTRMRPETLMRPKSMIEVSSRPFLQHLLLLLRRNGIKDIILGTGYLGSQVKHYFHNGAYFGVNIDYSHRIRLTETGLALKLAEPLLDSEFFYVNGDTYLELDYQEMLSRWKQSHRLAMVAISSVKAGNCLINDQKDLICYEKGGFSQTFVDAGVWLLRKEVIGLIPEEDISLSEGLLPRLINEQQVKTYISQNEFYDIGTSEGLETFREYIRREIK